MSKKIIFYQELCVACGACTVACMDQNDIYPQGDAGPLRKTYQIDFEKDGKMHIGYFSSACQHCDDAACIDACPASCIFKDPETGFTVFNTSDCIGCRSCSMACPHGAPTLDPDGKMIKCDGCNERVKAGLMPACVNVCPFSALKLEDR